MSRQILAGILKVFEDMNKTNRDNIKFTYSYDPEHISEFREQYSLDGLVEGKTDFGKSQALLQWIYRNIHHNGKHQNNQNKNAIDLLEYRLGESVSKEYLERSIQDIEDDCIVYISREDFEKEPLL